jgi:plastocyanin domain-containing protein
MFKTLYSVLNTCHFLKSSKSLHISASNGYPQVLIVVFFKKIAVILFSHARSSLCFSCVPVPLFFLACNLLKKQLLTPEDGQFRPKYVVILKILKSDKC